LLLEFEAAKNLSGAVSSELDLRQRESRDSEHSRTRKELSASMRLGSLRVCAWLGAANLIASTSAQDYNFVGALQIVNGVPSGAGYTQGSYNSGSGTNAVQAQCPADHPVSCTNIQQPN
jgi:hypothetical protein